MLLVFVLAGDSLLLLHVAFQKQLHVQLLLLQLFLRHKVVLLDYHLLQGLVVLHWHSQLRVQILGGSRLRVHHLMQGLAHIEFFRLGLILIGQRFLNNLVLNLTVVGDRGVLGCVGLQVQQDLKLLNEHLLLNGELLLKGNL